MSILTNLYLYFWRSHRCVGDKKEIRLTRTYETFGKDVLDVIWCLRDNRKISRDKKLSSYVITERVNLRNVKALIRNIERNELPKAIESFKQKMAESK